MGVDDSGPTLTVNFTDRDCDNPFGSVELLLPLQRVTTRSGAVCVMVDADETKRRLREAVIAFAQAFDSGSCDAGVAQLAEADDSKSSQ